MKKNIKELEIVDIEELLTKIEQEADSIESNFLRLHENHVPVFSFEIN
jgi:hypothetical protein